ncbi:MAG: non-homologous end-joining DNA ligase [Simkaniaceae bacterium]
MAKNSLSFIKPMLATLTHNPFSDENWIYERKLDGIRCLALKKNGKVTLYSRNQEKINSTYPEIAEAFQKQSADNFLIDGEIVAFQGKQTSFSKLQKRMNVQEPTQEQLKIPVYFYAFDMPFGKNKDLRGKPLLERKNTLKETLRFNDPIRFTTHRKENGLQFLKEACQRKWEGLIAKEKNSHYISKRSKKWLKFKCQNQQEFVIGGYTDPQGSRSGFGSLLLGYFEKGKFRYAGKVGTGFTEEILKGLKKKLDALKRKTSPYEEKIAEKNVHFVKPQLVAEVAFTEWTKEDKLRHPRFLGIRKDKKAKEVRKEK